MIPALDLVARLVLAGTFAAAGMAKLADRPGTRQAVNEFGSPARLAAPLALMLPLAELAAAGLLLPAATTGLGAAAVLALLGVFSAAVAVSLVRGRAPECHCFGQLHSAPASWKTLARNAALAALAAFSLVAASGHLGALAWMGRLRGMEIVALALAIALAVTVVAGIAGFLSLLSSYGRVLVRLDRVEHLLAEAGVDDDEVETPPELGLEPGTPAPAFAASDVAGAPVTLDDLLAPGRPLLLLFTSPHCGPCAELLPDAVSWQERHGDELTVAFAAHGAPDEIRAEAMEFELEHVLVDEEQKLYELFDAGGTPSAVLVEADGSIGSWVAEGRGWIELLVADVLARESDVELALGVDAPAFELGSLGGDPISLADLRGHDTLLLFWNPACGFCRSMHEQLLAREGWEASDAPRIVVISSGGEESTRADGFRSLVLLDEDFTAGTAFGATGTPMAVLLDAEGRVASGIVAGAEAVLTLAGRPGEPLRIRDTIET
jgi:thiol-disulfide isomerase/thioredoxin